MRQLPAASVGLIISGCILLMFAFGLRASYGLFVEPIDQANHWGRDVIGLALAIQNLVWGLVAVPAGALADRFGSARVIAGGAVLYCLGLWLTADVSSVWVLHASTGLLVGAGVAGTSFGIVLPAMARAVNPEQRQLALGVGTAAGSMGQFLLAPLVQGLIGAFGWSTALVIMSFMALSMALIAMPLATPAAATSHAPGGDGDLSRMVKVARGHRPYWLLILGFFVCGFHVAFITVHMPAFLRDAGFSSAIAAWSIGLIGLFNIFGSLLAGFASSRCKMRDVLIFIYSGRALAITLFMLVPLSATSIVLFSCVMGLLWLATVPPTSGLVAAMLGTRYMATFYGLVFLGHQLGSFSGVWLGGLIFESSGHYEPLWWIGVLLSLVAVGLHWPIRDASATEPVLLRKPVS